MFYVYFPPGEDMAEVTRDLANPPEEYKSGPYQDIEEAYKERDRINKIQAEGWL